MRKRGRGVRRMTEEASPHLPCNSPPSRVVIGALTFLPLTSVAWADTPFSLLTNTTYCVNGVRPVITPSVMLTLPYMVTGSEEVAIW